MPRCLSLGLICLLVAHPAGAEQEFDRDVAPILVRHCLECHNATEAAGKLDLTRRAGLMQGGESGPAIEAGRPDSSHLLARVKSGEMPPPKAGHARPLAEQEVETLENWIQAGAVWPKTRILDPYEATTETRAGRDWWAWQPLSRRAPPVNDRTDLQNPIDAWLFGQLAPRGWTFAPEAERSTLIRRLYHDLTGLPPSAEEITAFVADRSESAYEQLVDRLLASPRFGERWGRHWLDVVRFAETCGYERDQEKPQVWKYRDWVIQAFNRDQPYDRFVIEQLAGDELPDRSEATVIGTGFLRLGTWNDEPNDPEEYQFERLEEMVHATGVAFLGLSLKCARCHDHKFDPVPQTDYYRVANAFWAGYIKPGSGKLQGGPDAEQLGFEVLGWTDSSSTPPPLHRYYKGDPKRPGAVVEPGNLTLIRELDRPVPGAPAGARTTGRRLELARWVVDRNNPLTPRVWANRLWQYHFGRGIVPAPDNFGFAAGKPAHRELLDWLAGQLLADNWQSKRLHRLIVTSRAYRQAAFHPRQEEYEQADPNNELVWRAERRRREAEAVRDALLAASGQLNAARIGGPSVRLEVDPEALEGLSMKGNAWTVSPRSEQTRRGLYAFTKRGLLPPLLTAFDFPDTTLPCGQRDVTTVAPQSLAMLNNRFVHAQSENLAHQLTRRTANQQEQIVAAWQAVLGRTPTIAEIAQAKQHLATQTLHFGKQPTLRDEPSARHVAPETLYAGLALHLRADQELEVDADSGIQRWPDLSPHGRIVAQANPAARPRFVAQGSNGLPAVRFEGQRFFTVDSQVLNSQEFTISAVITDWGTNGHRELFSNWNGAAGNSVTSLFFGLTGQGRVRLSDDFVTTQEVPRRSGRFVLMAIADSRDATVYVNNGLLERKTHKLAPRHLATAYVVGTQGNYGSEFWQGDLAELLVFNRALDGTQREVLIRELLQRHAIPTESPAPTDAAPAPELLALASLCHVLMNTNEFLYVD